MAAEPVAFIVPRFTFFKLSHPKNWMRFLQSPNFATIMKRFTAYILFSLYLCANTECYQFLKLPILVSHFITHCQQDPQTTLRGFLEEHYAHDLQLDDDWQQDMQLPFKTHADICASQVPSLATDLIGLHPPVDFTVEPLKNPILASWHTTLQAFVIFQPPRV